MTTDVSRLTSALVGRYRIERELGRGGMATVYLAHDVRHDRAVAIKVLHEDLGATLGPERFLAEIKTTAKLHHPHILPLLDSGDAGGLLFYVMPFVDGESLRDRLTRDTQLAIDDAVRIAREVADALSTAHVHGIVHRDIKPENILLQGSHALVADFGIALAVQQAGGQRLTQTGLSLGTPQYMSPEQAMGDKTVDHRSDIYALGAVTYEMLTGDPPFTGSSIQAVVAKVLSAEPGRPTLTRKTIPPGVEAAVLTALAKLPADRFATAGEFAQALADGRRAVSTAATVTADSRRLTNRGLLPLAGWIAAAALAVALGWKRFASTSPATAHGMRFALAMGAGIPSDIEVEISPDGQRVVLPHARLRDGGIGMLVRDLSRLEPVALSGIYGEGPRISPDGQWMVYREDGRLRKVAVAGGTPTTVTDECGDTADWLDAQTIVCTTDTWGIGRVSSGGGPVELLVARDTTASELGLWSLDALPNGNGVLFTSSRRPASRIEVFDVKTRARRVLVENAVMARYARSGHLLFVRDNSLFAVRFDAKTLRVLGTAVPVLDDVAAEPYAGTAGFAISDNGTLAVVRESELMAPTRVVWVDRQGVERPAIRAPANYSRPRLSPDQSKVIVTVGIAGHRDLWLYDARRDLLAQLTRSTPGSSFRGVWTPDGREVLFSKEMPAYDVYRVRIDGSAPPVAVMTSITDKFPNSVSPDGSHFAFEEGVVNGSRVFVAPLDGSSAATAVSDSTLWGVDPAYSPDGRWIAYSDGGANSTRSVFVRRADGTGARLQVSVGSEADTDPRWAKGGREIVFRRGTAVYAVDVDVDAGRVGTERTLFDGPYPVNRGYDVTADGSQFIMVRVDTRPEALPILIITSFFDELRKKAGS